MKGGMLKRDVLKRDVLKGGHVGRIRDRNVLRRTMLTNQCDLHMPRKDGYQACREIREWEEADAAGGRHRPIPIIALSANVMSDVHEKCVEAGFSKYITKPVDFIALSRALAEFF